jgi:DNA (cytosine-5)-methyltransferase 1
MRYLSVCSGIEAATVAWSPLGWSAAAFSEIEKFPRAVLKHRFPDIPLHGRDRRRNESIDDYGKIAGFQTIKGDEYGPVDILVGGTPCQSFSVAGLRGGLADAAVCPGGPRYKALGNSMAVPVMAWIGMRLKMVDAGEVGE